MRRPVLIVGGVALVTVIAGIAVAASASAGTTTYEAEASANTLSGGAHTVDCRRCSGEQPGDRHRRRSARSPSTAWSPRRPAPTRLAVTYTSARTRTAQISVNGGIAHRRAVRRHPRLRPARHPAGHRDAAVRREHDRLRQPGRRRPGHRQAGDHHRRHPADPDPSGDAWASRALPRPRRHPSAPTLPPTLPTSPPAPPSGAAPSDPADHHRADPDADPRTRRPPRPTRHAGPPPRRPRTRRRPPATRRWRPGRDDRQHRAGQGRLRGGDRRRPAHRRGPRALGGHGGPQLLQPHHPGGRRVRHPDHQRRVPLVRRRREHRQGPAHPAGR